MNENELAEFELHEEYLQIVPEGSVLSPDMLKQEYATSDYIMSVYRKCVNEKKPYWQVVPKEHFLEDMPDSDY